MKNFLVDIQRLRGVACLLVLLQHIALICPLVWLVMHVPPHFRVGSGAVHIFFAISGFVITLSIKDKLPTGGTFLERVKGSSSFLGEFYVKRFFRIVPVMMFVLLLAAVFFGMTESNTAWLSTLCRIPAEVFAGVYNYSVEKFVTVEKLHLSGTGPFWTLGLEMQFYLLWPLVLMMLPSHSDRACLSLSLGLLFLLVIQPVCVLFFGYYYYAIYQNISAIFLGAFLAYLYTGEKIKVNAFYSTIAMLFLIATVWLYPNVMPLSVFYSQIVVSLASVAAVALAVFVGNSFAIPLVGQFLEYLGNRSYSFYAVQLVLASVVVYFTQADCYADYGLKQFLIFIVVLYLTTEFVYNCIEKPLRNFGNK